jgi:alpha-galactosidase
MSKLVIIGAGSTIFLEKLIVDMACIDELSLDAIALVDIDSQKLGIMEKLACKVFEQAEKRTKIKASTDRTAVLSGADYVVCTIGVGDVEIYKKDLGIPDEYRVSQNVGDTVGPGGVFRGLRVVPEIAAICRDMEKHCPGALLFNYSNPMCIVQIALSHATEIKSYGLCHSVQGTAENLASYLRVPVSELTYLCAGINHMAWFLEIRAAGGDAYPKLRDIAASRTKVLEVSKYETEYSAAGIRLIDLVRFDILKHFGYFVTESPFHMSEYVPYFRKNPELIKSYCVDERWWLEHEKSTNRNLDTVQKTVDSDAQIQLVKSKEYLPDIILALESGILFEANLNVRNTSLISNLPQKCCVEVPCVVDSSGIHPCYVGDLPEQCAALNRSNINVQILAAQAALETNRQRKIECIMQAVKLDPLTSSLLTLDQITSMVQELIEANREYLSL